MLRWIRERPGFDIAVVGLPPDGGSERAWTPNARRNAQGDRWSVVFPERFGHNRGCLRLTKSLSTLSHTSTMSKARRDETYNLVIDSLILIGLIIHAEHFLCAACGIQDCSWQVVWEAVEVVWKG